MEMLGFDRYNDTTEFFAVISFPGKPVLNFE